MGGQAGQAAAGSGGGGILLQKHLVSSDTFHDVDSTTYVTILTQEVTVAATNRVYIDGTIYIQTAGNDNQCNIRIIRGTDEVAMVEGEIGFNGETQAIPIRALETPGAGTYTYNIDVARGGANDCEVNQAGATSFMTTEVLSANP